MKTGVIRNYNECTAFDGIIAGYAITALSIALVLKINGLQIWSHGITIYHCLEYFAFVAILYSVFRYCYGFLGKWLLLYSALIITASIYIIKESV